MATEEMKKNVAQSREEGFMIFCVEDGQPIPLDGLIKMVQSVYPNLSLSQLAITEADEGKFIVSVEIGATTKKN